MRIEGTLTALVTPFNKKGEVDKGVLRDLVEFQIESGISGLVPTGTTGESPTLTHDEQVLVITTVVKQARGRVVVVAGTGANSTAEALTLTKAAADVGADASLQVSPYYNKPNQEGLYRHFSTIADTVELPLVLYNIPGRSACNIESSTILQLAQHERIVGLKDASGNVTQAMEIIPALPDHFALLSGDDNLALPLTLLGGKGVISVAANVIPDLMEQMIRKALNGDTGEALKEHYRLLPLFKAVFCDTNPIPVKFMLSLCERVQESYRLPLTPLDDARKKRVHEVLKTLQLI